MDLDFRKALNWESTVSVNREILGDGMRRKVVLREVEEGVLLERRLLEVIALDLIDMLIGSDATPSIDGAPGIGQFDLAVGVVLRV